MENLDHTGHISNRLALEELDIIATVLICCRPTRAKINKDELAVRMNYNVPRVGIGVVEQILMARPVADPDKTLGNFFRCNVYGLVAFEGRAIVGLLGEQ